MPGSNNEEYDDMKPTLWNKFEDYSQDPPTLEEFKACIPVGVPISEEQKERCYHWYNARGWMNVRNLASAVSNWVAWQRDREVRMAQQPKPGYSFPNNRPPNNNQPAVKEGKLRTRVEQYFGMTEAEMIAESQK